MPATSVIRVALAAAIFSSVSFACSVLSHEAVIDALWDVKLKPVLQSAYPSATPEELKRAHGFAYGGAIIQDLGYYPHGNKKFSDLAHYVRTGDFVLALITESRSLEELAFALGALSHYTSDMDVHRYATNPGEAMLYPKLKRKFGPIVTYAEDPAAHLKTEFGFDVLEVAKGRYAPAAYHDFIGFYVAPGVLDRAMRDTYGLSTSDLFPDFDRTIGSFRRAVSNWIPKATRVAWAQREKDIQNSEPGMTRRRFVYVMRRSSYEREWGKDYDRPTAGDRVLAVLLRLVPPIGPLRALRFRMPTPNVEKLFMASFDRCAGQYRRQLGQVQTRSLTLQDVNYDLGRPTGPGEYKLQDDAYAFWLDHLAKNKFATATPEIRAALLTFYSDLNAPIDTKRHPKDWERVLAEISALKQGTAQPVQAHSSAISDSALK